VSLFTIEQHLVQQLSQNEEFARLFHNLFIGTRRRDVVRSLEQRVQHRLAAIMRNIEVTEEGKVRSRDGHYLSELAARIFNRLESGVMEAVRSGQIASHPAMDSEYVNGPLFERFVQDEIALDRDAGKLVPSGRTVQGFVDVFRSMYNSAAGAA
jgi:hypothetical protein